MPLLATAAWISAGASSTGRTQPETSFPTRQARSLPYPVVDFRCLRVLQGPELDVARPPGASERRRGVELGAAAPIDAGKLLGTGLVLAVGTALVPLFFGADALTSTWFTIALGPIGSIDFVTSTIFDIGVYLVVIGLVLDVLRSLGAEVDRQQETEAGVAP